MAEELALAAIDINDPDGYYGGPKQGRVLSYGSIRRSMSDPIGRAYQVASASLTVADDDRAIRDVIATNVTRNSVLDYFIYSDVNRRAQGDALRLFQGVVRSDEELDPLTVRLNIEDRFGSQFSQFDLGKIVPTDVILPQYFSTAPLASYGRPEPLCYGRLSDEPSISGTSPPILVGDSARGAFLEGIHWQAGWGEMLSGATPVTNVTLTALASGTVSADVPAATYGLIVTAIDVQGRESNPTPFHYGPTTGLSPGSWPGYVPTAVVSGTDKLRAEWTAGAGAVKYRAYIGFYYYGARWVQYIETTNTFAEFTTSGAWSVGSDPDYINITPGAIGAGYSSGLQPYYVTALMPDGETATAIAYVGGSTGNYSIIHIGLKRVSRVEWTALTGALSYFVYKGLPTDSNSVRWSVPSTQLYFDDDLSGSGAMIVPPQPEGIVPVIPVGKFILPDATEWDGFLVCRGCATYVQSWYVAEQVWISDTEYVIKRVKQLESTEGVDYLIPGRNAWKAIFGNVKYIDIGDRRYTMIFARGVKADAAVDGTAPITVNIFGYDTVGDGMGPNGDETGQVWIDDLPRQYLHFLTNFVVQPTQLLWQPIPLNADGYSIINGQAFEDAKTYYDTFLPGSLKGAWMLGHEDHQVLNDVLAELNRCLDGDLFANRNGQLDVDVCDTEAVSAGTVNDVEDVLEDSFRAWQDVSHLFNEVVYRFARVYTEQVTKPTPAEADLLPRELADKTEWASGVLSMYDPTSVAIYGEVKTYDMDLPMIRDQASAELLVKRWLVAYTNGARYVSLDMNLCATDYELSDVLTLTHFAGVGLTGWAARRLRFIGVEMDLDNFKASLEFRDLNFTYTDIFA